MGNKTKYTKELLGEIAKESICIRDVLRMLGLKLTGGSQSHIKALLKRYEIDTTHFLGQASRKGLTNGLKKHWSEILVLSEGDRRTHGYMLRRALIESGVEYKCACCGQTDVWNGKPLVLEVDHKNDNWLDNRKENLQFLCPNCHSQRIVQVGKLAKPPG